MCDRINYHYHLIASHCWENPHLFGMLNIECHEAVFGYVLGYYICWFHKHEEGMSCSSTNITFIWPQNLTDIPYLYFVAAKQNDNNKWMPWEMTIIPTYSDTRRKIEIYFHIKKCSTASHARSLALFFKKNQSLKLGFLPTFLHTNIKLKL